MNKENNESAPQEETPAESSVRPDANAAIYENRGPKKIVRVVTVMAYMFSVSFVAIVLSVYYLFLWEPPNPRLIHRSHLVGEPQAEFLVGEPRRFEVWSKDLFRSAVKEEFEKDFTLLRSRIAESAEDYQDNLRGNETSGPNESDLEGRGNEFSEEGNSTEGANEDFLIERSRKLSRLRNRFLEIFRGLQNKSRSPQDTENRTVQNSVSTVHDREATLTPDAPISVTEQDGLDKTMGNSTFEGLKIFKEKRSSLDITKNEINGEKYKGEEEDGEKVQPRSAPFFYHQERYRNAESYKEKLITDLDSPRSGAIMFNFKGEQLEIPEDLAVNTEAGFHITEKT